MKRTGGIAVVAVVAAAGVYLLNWIGVLAFTSADGTDVAARLSAELGARVGGSVHVSCPARIPQKRGGIEDCVADAGHGTTVVRVVQDDSRGHSHWTVTDLTVLTPAATPAPVVSSPAAASTSVTAACVGAGASPDQCGCVEQQIRDQGDAADLTRAADAYAQRRPLPDDLARMVESCRRGA